MSLKASRPEHADITSGVILSEYAQENYLLKMYVLTRKNRIHSTMNVSVMFAKCCLACCIHVSLAGTSTSTG